MPAGRGHLAARQRLGARWWRRAALHALNDTRRMRAVLADARVLTGSPASGARPSAGTVLVGRSDGLEVLDRGGTRLRSWDWSEIIGWDADGTAPDGEGRLRQLLTVRTRSGAFTALVDAGQLGGFLGTLAGLRDAFGTRPLRGAPTRRSARAGRRIAVAVASTVLGVGMAVVTPALLARPVPDGARARHVRQGGMVGLPTPEETAVHLAKATMAPAPAPASLGSSPLAPREAFGFLPYWALEDPASVDLSSLTTVAYFSVDVRADGTVDESPSSPGWVGYESQAFAGLVTQAHRGGARVVLSASCFDQGALDVLTNDPAAQETLAATLVSLVRAKHLDGVNLDLEGVGPTDRSGLDALVARVSGALRAADPAWQLTVDVYASSAEDPRSFYDVEGMSPYVDAFVVMAYDMGTSYAASPTGLPPGGPGLTDRQIVTSYTSAVGASKVILAMPLYGEDWPTTGPTAGDPATGPPTPVADDEIAPTDALYWDPLTGGPWAAYRTGGQWHQIWFDDAASLAAKTDLARAAGLRGVALWALGMAVGTGDQQAAVSGVSPVPQPPDGPVVPWKGPLPQLPGSPSAGAQPAATAPGATSAPAAGAFGTGSLGTGSLGTAAAGGAQGVAPPARGVFDGVTVSLVPWPGALPAAVTSAGALGTFDAAATPVACLATSPPLPVVQIDGTSAFIVRASTPADCASGTWAFVLPASPGSTAAAGGDPASSGKSTGSGAALATGSASAPPTGSGSHAVEMPAPGPGSGDAATQSR